MLRSIESLHRATVSANDGDIGHVDQAYFDDERWGVRYLVVEAGNWFRGRQVLISPYSVRDCDLDSSAVHVDLSLRQIEDSPDIDTHKPVSRQHEINYLGYYNYPQYWGGPSLWGFGPYPMLGLPEAPAAFPPAGAIISATDPEPAPDDIHLRSTEALHGYQLVGSDGNAGRVRGFIFDDAAWVIRYLVVDLRNWWPGGKAVLLPTELIRSIDWQTSTVSTSLTRDVLKDGPEYDDAIVLDQGYEAALRDYYVKGGYLAAHSGSTPAMPAF